MTLNITNGHAPRIHRDDLVVESFKSPLVLLDNLWFILAVTVTGYFNTNIAYLGEQGLFAGAVAGISRVSPFGIVGFVSQVVFHLGVHRFLNNALRKFFDQSAFACYLLGREFAKVNVLQQLFD